MTSINDRAVAQHSSLGAGRRGRGDGTFGKEQQKDAPRSQPNQQLAGRQPLAAVFVVGFFALAWALLDWSGPF
jgi:hypothetical protein